MKCLLISTKFSAKYLPGLLLFKAVVLFLFTGCNTEKAPKQYTIGFSQCISGPWRETMYEDMKRELAYYPNIKLVFKQADASNQRQIEQVNELLSQGIDLLIISPNEAEPLTPVVEQAYKKGVAVIVIDRKTSSSSYTAYVGGDNYEVGRMAGEYAIDLLKGTGRVIEFTLLPGSSNSAERHNGFTEALKQYPLIQLVKSINGELLKQQETDSVLSAIDGDNVDLVFAQNDFLALKVAELYEKKGLSKPKIIGADGLPLKDEGMDLVARKIITATMLYPTGGEEAIQTAVKILNKEPFSKENNIGTTVIDSTNVRYMLVQANKMSSQQHSIERQQNMLLNLKTIYNNQRTFLYVLVFSLVTALALAGIVFFSLRRNRKINTQLQARNDEILEQKNKVEEMSARAHEANEAKVKFFTNVSHEFRTPLTLTLAPLEELMANIKNQNQVQSLNLIHKNVYRLFRLVNQLLDFRKIEVEKMGVRATENDVILFVADIVQSYRSIAFKRNIDLRLITNERQLNVWFDGNMIDKVIFNLLSNAFKFTKNGGFINVYINKTEDGKAIYIKVEDNGIGMNKEAAEKVFDVFYQGEYENYKGSGLGLALSKEFVKLHKGSISVVSEKGKGTTFEVRLLTGKEHFSNEELAEASMPPVSHSEEEKIYTSDLEGEQRMNREISAYSGSKEHSVLIIEDNPELRGFLADRLSADYEILEADNGQAALNQAFDSIPDLIISDVVIPGKDGMAVTNILKNDIRTSHIPIVLLTAKTSIEQQIEGMKNMADVYITKPFNLQFLQQSLKSLLVNRLKLKDHFTGDISASLKTQTVNKLDRKFMNEFTSLIESNVSNDEFGVEDICKQLGISKVQLYRKVKALMNINVNEFIVDTRLQKAKYLLQHEELSISEIAYKVGFSSPAYFSTVFKSKFGVTPKAFKER